MSNWSCVVYPDSIYPFLPEPSQAQALLRLRLVTSQGSPYPSRSPRAHPSGWARTLLSSVLLALAPQIGRVKDTQALYSRTTAFGACWHCTLSADPASTLTDTARATMPSASMQVLEWEPVPEPAATIYTFMGLATIPRLRGGSSLRLLPREMLLKVASFAYSSAFCAAWSYGSLLFFSSEHGVLSYRHSREGMEATSVDLTSYLRLKGDGDATGLRMSRPIRHGVTFVEIEVGSAWFNTEVNLLQLGEMFSLFLCSGEGGEAHHRAALVAKDDIGDNILHLVPEFDDCWEWCETVTFGLLVDMDRGCCTFYLNSRRGPCVRLPGIRWRRPDIWDGIRIAIEDFPFGDDGFSPKCVVTCSSFVPQGALRDPKLHQPKAVAEHLASGVLRYE